MAHGARRNWQYKICLVEHVLSARGIVVRGQRNRASVRRNDTGHVVLISLVVVAEHRSITNHGAVELMFNERGCEMDIGTHVAVVGIAVIRRRIHCCSTALKGCDAAVCDAPVMQVFIAGYDPGSVVWNKGHRRIDAGSFQIDVVAKAS